VTRARLAYLVACGLAGSEDNVPAGPPSQTFVDLPPDDWAYKYVEYTVAQGMTLGYADSTFRPEQKVSRAELAVWGARIAAGGEASVPPAPSTPSFVDVPTDHWAYKHIEHLRTLVHDPWSWGPIGEFAPRQDIRGNRAASWLEQCLGAPVNACDADDYSGYDYADYQTTIVEVGTGQEETAAQSEPGPKASVRTEVVHVDLPGSRPVVIPHDARTRNSGVEVVPGRGRHVRLATIICSAEQTVGA